MAIESREMMWPTMTYEADRRLVKKQRIHKMSVAKMTMFRWMCGKTRKDGFRNERIWEHLGVASMG